ncbi:hypothetical protein [Methanobacterium paludis]|uniref:Uncharacterized protein n=1 Tax=Methanobacterium paludis (strain DSM 25820 / JCM 18151 / SWAN1) TaxID=868131 RepID=F6D2T7_METPW|nr:hypothetical protein [Methanobacterium paludis]AEG18666.1 hypothetical protein MSWAN_1655 [Methanobacterium paludis]
MAEIYAEFKSKDKSNDENSMPKILCNLQGPEKDLEHILDNVKKEYPILKVNKTNL